MKKVIPVKKYSVFYEWGAVRPKNYKQITEKAVQTKLSNLDLIPKNNQSIEAQGSWSEKASKEIKQYLFDTETDL